MKRVYITATRRNDGKTVVTLGLTMALRNKTQKIGFMKPFGKQDYKQGNVHVDLDTLLIEKVCNVHAHVQDMSPVNIDAEFSKRYFKNLDIDSDDLMRRITSAYQEVSADKDLVVIEGTGHACSGSVFGLSNARIASVLDAPVIIVSSGGVGHPLDEISLNISFFQSRNVPVLGVIINKAYPHEIETLDTFGRNILKARWNLPLFGIIPADPLLSQPTVLDILESVNGKPISKSDTGLGDRVKRIVVGAMTANEALKRLEDGDLLITGGDRSDLILAAVSARKMGGSEPKVAAMILTCGVVPPDPILRLIEEAGIPAVLVEEDSYTVARKTQNLVVHLTPRDTEKIDRVEALIAENVDIEAIYKAL